MNEPSEALIAACQSELADAMRATDGVIFAMAATVDGLEVASQNAPGWDISSDRLAAMASSGHALGDTVSGELADTPCQNMIIDADRVSIVFLAVPDLDNPPLILGMAATRSASLGNVLVSARQCAKRIAQAQPNAA